MDSDESRATNKPQLPAPESQGTGVAFVSTPVPRLLVRERTGVTEPLIESGPSSEVERLKKADAQKDVATPTRKRNHEPKDGPLTSFDAF